MRICFIIPRNRFYCNFSPIIDEALRRGHEVFCFHDASQPKTGQKGRLYPHLHDVPHFKHGLVLALPYHSDSDFEYLVMKFEIDVVFSLLYYPKYITLHERLRKMGVKWVALQHAFDVLATYDCIKYPDRYYMFSEAWRDLAASYLEGTQTDNVRCFGYPELDVRESINESEVKEEFKIPEDKPVVTLMQFLGEFYENRLYSRYIYGTNNPVIQSLAVLLKPEYFDCVWKGLNDVNVFKAIKKFCDWNDAELIVKRPEKSSPLSYIKDARVVSGDAFYPPTVLQLLKISDVSIKTYSFTVPEAAAFGVPSVCIAHRLEDLHVQTLKRYNHIAREMPDVFDYESVSRLMTVDELISDLPKMDLADFKMNSVSQQKYVEKYLTSNDGKSSERIVQDIEGLV